MNAKTPRRQENAEKGDESRKLGSEEFVKAVIEAAMRVHQQLTISADQMEDRNALR
jgi:hypothetical protein